MGEQSLGVEGQPSTQKNLFKIQQTFEQGYFSGKGSQSLFAMWCEANDHITPIFDERAKWEKMSDILKEDRHGNKTLHVPKDLYPWETMGIIKAIDPESKEKIINLGQTFLNTGVYLAKRLSHIDEGQEIAQVLAKEFYNYGESLITERKPDKSKTIEEIASIALNDEDTKKVDLFLAGENLYLSRLQRAENKIKLNPNQANLIYEQERQATLNQFFRVYQKAFELQQKKYKYRGNQWKTPHITFIEKIESSIKEELERPQEEIFNTVLHRGMKILGQTMSFDKLPTSVKNTLFNGENSETTLIKAAKIDELKQELEEARQLGNKSLISTIESYIVDRIQLFVSSFPYQGNAFTPVSIRETQKRNCVGASLLSGVLLQAVGINYLVAQLPRHSMIFIIYGNDTLESREMLEHNQKRQMTDTRINGKNYDGSPMTVANIIDITKNPKARGITFNFKKEDYYTPTTLYKPEDGFKLQILVDMIDSGQGRKRAHDEAINEMTKINSKVIGELDDSKPY